MQSTSEKIKIQNYSSICYDSRKVTKNSVFVCLRGEKFDGHKFIQSTLDAGASLIVVEKNHLSDSELKEFTAKHEFEIIQVDDTRDELARLSSLFYGEPTKTLNLIGITGTNGKTTVAHLVQRIFAKEKCSLLGTIGYKEEITSEYIDLGNTTPQSTDVQAIFHKTLEKKIPYLVMEVSSHALDQARVAHMDYRCAVVTNLSQDHLDYHMTMEKYFDAKAKLFDQVSDYAVLNVDDEYYSKFRARAEAQDLRIVTYGVENDADFKAENVEFTDHGLSFQIEFNGKRTEINMQLNGMFNVYNTLAALVVGAEEGLDNEAIKVNLESTPPVAGRFEVVTSEKSPFCIVDYAHTPDGLENVLRGAQAILKPNAKLICLFGCGGDRDITKRPKMGKIAFDLSDFIYVTSDNPRTEDPDQIIADILAGIPNLDKAKVIPDRAQAIKEAVINSKPEDIVVIAGKGHETYQILPSGTIDFDDREKVREAIELL